MQAPDKVMDIVPLALFHSLVIKSRLTLSFVTAFVYLGYTKSEIKVHRPNIQTLCQLVFLVWWVYTKKKDTLVQYLATSGLLRNVGEHQLANV